MNRQLFVALDVPKGDGKPLGISVVDTAKKPEFDLSQPVADLWRLRIPLEIYLAFWLKALTLYLQHGIVMDKI